MKKTLPILITFIFFATNTIFAQYTETINSNRPGDSHSAFSVGSNVIQIETGAYFLNEKHELLDNKVKGVGLNFTLRYGLILEELELQVSGVYQNDKHTDMRSTIDTEYNRSNFKKFKISFVVQASAYQTATAGGYQLDVPMGLLGNNLILSHSINIVFPVSVSTSSATEGYRTLYGIFDTTYHYDYFNETQKNPASITVIYQATIGAAARPMIFAIIIGIIAAFYVSYRKVELPEEIIGPHIDDYADSSQSRQTGAPPELLRDFANLYSRKTALSIDLEKLEASRRKGKVKKREYMIREKDLKKQIEEIDSQLPKIKEDMTRHGARYRDIVAQLELQNEKIEGAKAGLRQLLLRKKKQRISRVAFEKSRQDYLKTIQKATSATDRILLSIQEEAGDI